MLNNVVAEIVLFRSIGLKQGMLMRHFTHWRIQSNRYGHMYMMSLELQFRNSLLMKFSVLFVRLNVSHQFNFLFFLESKQDIAKSVLTDLREEMEQYGFEIVDTLVIDVEPDEKVRYSMNEINANKRLRQAAIYKSEVWKKNTVI